jgi:hypothetical protein
MSISPTPVDERGGKPSSSGMERYSLCPGSFVLEKSIPAERRLGQTKYSLHGTKVAALVEKLLNNGITFTTKEHEEYALVEAAVVEPDSNLHESIISDAKKMVLETFEVVKRAGLDPEDRSSLYLSEHRIWSTCNTFSGKPDVLVTNQRARTLIVIDHKSGWIKVPDAEKNHQIRSNIALAVDRLRADTWRCIGAIIQPNLGRFGCSFHEWTPVSKETPSDLVLQYRKLANYINHPSPSPIFNVTPDACRYCPARIECDAIKDVFTKVATLQMKPANFEEALRLCSVCEMVIKDYRSGATEALKKDPNAIPGWKLEPGNVVTKINNPALAFDAVKDVVKPVDYMACCTVALGKLTDAFAKGSGIPKSKARDPLMARIEKFTTTTQNQPSLKQADLVSSDPE